MKPDAPVTRTRGFAGAITDVGICFSDAVEVCLFAMLREQTLGHTRDHAFIFTIVQCAKKQLYGSVLLCNATGSGLFHFQGQKSTFIIDL